MLLTFVVGGIVYVFYRPIVNNLIIDGVHRGLHRRLEGLWGFRASNSGAVGYNCKLHYLEDRFRVQSNASFDAFRSVRDRLFDPDRRDRFELNHSENHLLGMTFLVLFMFGIVAWVLGRPVVSAVFGAISICSLGLEISSDLFICRRECRYLMTLETENVREVLQKAEFS